MWLPQLNYAPSGTDAGGAVEDKALGVEDTIELLSEPDEEKELELEKPDKKEGDEEKTLEDEIEEELEEPDEDKLELVTPNSRKEILTKYPQLFKDFPSLEKAYYREQKYSEILPTIDDAKEAVENSQALHAYEEKLLAGDTTDVLKAIKNEDEEAFHKIVDNYLPTLFKVDEPSYYHVVGNIIRHTIITMVKEDNEELAAAANVLNKFMFGTDKFVQPSSLAKGEKPEDNKVKEIEQREKQLTQREFERTESNLSNRVENILKSTIDKNIDPKETMSEYVRRNATRDAQEELNSIIAGDTRFRTILDRLWERAFADNFSPNSVDRIKSAYLSKAKTLLPSVIKKARNEALKGQGKRVTDDDEETKDKRGPLPVGNTRTATSSSGGKTVKDKAREIPKGMKTVDYLMQD